MERSKNFRKSRRKQRDLYLETLKAVKKHDKITRMMYETGLSWTSISRVLKYCISHGLIDVKEKEYCNRKTYGITDKGENALRLVHEGKFFIYKGELIKAK